MIPAFKAPDPAPDEQPLAFLGRLVAAIEAWSQDLVRTLPQSRLHVVDDEGVSAVTSAYRHHQVDSDSWVAACLR